MKHGPPYEVSNSTLKFDIDLSVKMLWKLTPEDTEEAIFRQMLDGRLWLLASHLKFELEKKLKEMLGLEDSGSIWQWLEQLDLANRETDDERQGEESSQGRDHSRAGG